MSNIDFDEIAETISPEQYAAAIDARPSGSSGSYHCPCPDHENGDGSASLSIERVSGKTLVNSFVCDVKGTVVQAASKLWNVSLQDAGERLASAAGIMTTPTTSSKGNGLGEEVAWYSYTDEDGVLLYEVVRFAHPKDFRPRQPDGTWSLKGVRRVLYKLPEVVGGVSDGRLVFITEGEKDADLLAEHGFVATTFSGGAGATTGQSGVSRWRDYYSANFKGARVVILPDADDAGRKHAQKVAGALHGVASEIRVLELPDLPPKGDVSDWFEGGGTDGAFKKLVEGRPIWEPSTTVAESRSTEDTEEGSTLSVKEILEKSEIWKLSENPEMEDVDIAMRKLRSLVAGVGPGLSSLIRGEAIKALEQAKVRAPAKVVDGYLASKSAESQPEPEPPPNEADLLEVGSSILESEDPLALIQSRANEARYAGNTSALELLVLVVASRVLDTPINALLKGPSAGGKSYTVECALQFHPPEAVHLLTSSSERALIYSDEDFQHRHIVIAEASGLQQDGVGATIMRELAWGGRGIRYETVEKVGGELRARLIEKPGPTGLITTSTGNLDKEMATRLLTISIDDSPEQTKEILASLGAEAEDGGGSLWERLDFSGWHAAFRWMFHYGTRDVQVPYARTLAGMVTRGDVRLRRDFRQVLAVVRVSALISQRHRQRSDNGEVVADLEDYHVAYRLLCGALAISMDQVSTVIRETVEKVTAAVEDHPDDYGISVTALAKLMGTPKQTTHYRVTQALRAEFIANLETRKGHAAKLRPAEPLPEDRGVIPKPEELQFAIEGGIPSKEPPENDSDIGTPSSKAAPMLDEPPSQRVSEVGNCPNGTPGRSDTYSDTSLASNEATKRPSVPMSERNREGVRGGISPPRGFQAAEGSQGAQEPRDKGRETPADSNDENGLSVEAGMQTEVLDPENGSPPSDGVADVPVREEPDHTSSDLFDDLPKGNVPTRNVDEATPDPSGLDL